MDTKEYIEFLGNQKRYDIPPPNRFNKQIDEIIEQLQEGEKWKNMWKDFEEKYGYANLEGVGSLKRIMNDFEENILQN